MNKEKLILIGSGQHARVVMYNIKEQNRYDVVCMLDSDSRKIGEKVNDIEVVGTYEELEQYRRRYNTNKFFVAFGNMKYRREVYDKFISQGWEAVNIIHPQAVISPKARLGNGVLVECGCLITPNPIIGNNVVINTGSQVNHDNVIEDHVYIASGVVLSGNVRIEENTLLDDGVIVSLGKCIGSNSIVGAGAVVTHDIPKDVIAYGNPAKVIRKNK
ncbi:2%2C3%2C4%2C5-tetrahydropyridine-2%2C6-dicarboxy late N-acetyltransferase [uncultured Eubacterium sp.]|nr:2%2C3%2C4%2C5-tetrahydropyridine-2%2C6-dicarboxy late N-acetyltransferase [uncultured Eubacterium sp.]